MDFRKRFHQFIGLLNIFPTRLYAKRRQEYLFLGQSL